MRKTGIIILTVLVISILAGPVMSKDLSPEELRSMLGKVEQQKFDTRDAQNKKVESKKTGQKVAGIFRLVERIQNLKAQIEVPTVFGTVLYLNNNLARNNSSSERSNLYALLDNIRLPETIWTVVRNKKSYMLDYLPASFSPAGLTSILISFLIVALGILPVLEEPRFRFQVQRE